MKKVRRIRGGTGKFAPAPQSFCPHHKEAMPFDPMIRGWACPVEGCSYRKYRKQDIDQFGPPLVCEGPLSVTLVEDSSNNTQQLILRGSNNVAVDLTSVTTDVRVEQEATYSNSYVVVELIFNNGLTVLKKDAL